MFNEEQKNEYIAGTAEINRQLPKWIRTAFGRTERMELILDKDVSVWTSSEIIGFYKSLCLFSLNSLSLWHSQLSAYARWCLARNLIGDGQSHYIEIEADALRECLNLGMQENGIVSRHQLENIITELLNPRDQCLVYALFEGIQGKMFSELTELNVSQLEGNRLHLAERTIEVSDRFIELMRETTEEYTYYSYGEKESKIIPYCPDDANVFKATANSTQTTQIRKRQRLYNNLVRIKRHIGNPAINSQSLIESGRIDMVKRLMGTETGFDLYGVLKKHEDEIANKYGRIYSYKNYILAYGRFYERG